jgi:hypothetical protein
MFLYIALALLAFNNIYCIVTAIEAFKAERVVRTFAAVFSALAIDAAVVFVIWDVVRSSTDL